MKFHLSATLFPHRAGLYSRGRGLTPEPAGPKRGTAVVGRGQKGGAIQHQVAERGGQTGSRAARPGRGARVCALASAAFLAGLFIASPGIALDPKSATRNDSQPAEFANISGIWRLDWTLSDTRPRVDGSADFGRPRVQGGPRSGGGEDGSGGGRSRSRQGGAGRQERPEDSGANLIEWARSRLTVQTLIIFQQGARIEISENGSRIQTVDVEGVAPPPGAARTDPAGRHGRWEHAVLVVTSPLDGGATLVERFSIEPNGPRLDVASRIQPGRNEPPIVMNRVYRRYGGV